MNATRTVTAEEVSTGSSTMADLPMLAARRHGDTVVFRFSQNDRWADVTFEELGEIVQQVALGLMALGVKLGERVAILSNTRPEWCYADFGALAAGAIVVPIYQTNSPDECEYVLANSGSTVVIVEDREQLEKIRKIESNLPQLRHIVVIADGDGDESSMSLAALKQLGAAGSRAAYEERVGGVSPKDTCTIIYTSGTTGPPKGCVVTHGNYRDMLDMLEADAVFEKGELGYLYLPLAHSMARLIVLAAMDVGATIGFFRSIDMILADLMELKPTYFPSVPRMFEKIYAMATSVAEKGGPEQRERLRQAIEVGKQVRKLQLEGREPEGELAKAFKRADEEVFQKVRGLFGGRLKTAVTGAAPISPEILEFFWACGLTVLEAWGLTETSTVATFNREEDFKFGTVGKPVNGCEVKIADDGEILVKGPNIFQGYWKNDKATRETIVDSWLHTGDLGKFDEDGFLIITGRKKDIIITAGGKNITPANLENALKQNQFISQAVVHGDRRPYLTALITLDVEEIAAWAAERGIETTDAAELATHPKVIELIQAIVDGVNMRLARVEQIKKFKVLPHDLTQEGGELTPTLKVKRGVVNEKYAAQLDALYS